MYSVEVLPLVVPVDRQICCVRLVSDIPFISEIIKDRWYNPDNGKFDKKFRVIDGVYNNYNYNNNYEEFYLDLHNFNFDRNTQFTFKDLILTYSVNLTFISGKIFANYSIPRDEFTYYQEITLANLDAAICMMADINGMDEAIAYKQANNIISPEVLITRTKISNYDIKVKTKSYTHCIKVKNVVVSRIVDIDCLLNRRLANLSEILSGFSVGVCREFKAAELSIVDMLDLDRVNMPISLSRLHISELRNITFNGDIIVKFRPETYTNISELISLIFHLVMMLPSSMKSARNRVD
jgi:hypothetical protein